MSTRKKELRKQERTAKLAQDKAERSIKWPKVTDGDVIFSTQQTNQGLLAEAKEKGFYNGHTPYNDLFSTLFYKGGSINYKQGLDPVVKERASRYLRALIGSFAPKHEEKEAVCALILSEIAEV